jgi:hypothetical protein
MNAPANILVPCRTDIAAHLYALFDPTFVQPYPDAWIEIAYGHAATGGDIYAAQNFSVFELEKAVAFAEKKNRDGFNLYVGPAIRQGERPKTGRASDTDVVTSAYAWSEFDGSGDDVRIAGVLKEKDIAQAIIVITGHTPNLRAHLYFKLDGEVTPNRLLGANTALVTLLGGDAVQAVGHVMRLAGTINWPTPKKKGRGYIPELVTLHANPSERTYTADKLMDLSGGESTGGWDEFMDSLAKPPKTDDELTTLLKAGQVKEWHINMRNAVAVMIGRGWNDLQIKLSCAPYCEGQENDPDLEKLIETGRKKFGKPDVADTVIVLPSLPVGPLIVSSKGFLEGFIPPDYLIDGILQRRFLYSMTAPTGTGKTAIALMLAYHVAQGLSLGDVPVEKGRVLYLAGENPDDIRMRLLAGAEKMGFDPDTINVHFLPGSFKISEICARIQEEVLKTGPVALVVVDTSAAYFGGDDENANVQMGAHARVLRTLVSLPGAPAILVCCHPVKNAAPDNMVPKGGGSFLNEVDGNLTCAKTDSVVTMHWQGKFRGPDFAPLPFQLHTVTTDRLRDSKDRLIPSVVATPLSDKDLVEADVNSRRDEDSMLLEIDHGEHRSLNELAGNLEWLTRDGRPNKTKAQRVVERLKKGALVKVERGGHVLTTKGKDAIKRLKGL